MTSCKCGQKIFLKNWEENKCCNFFINKYKNIPSDYYLFFNDNLYWFDNKSCRLYQVKGNNFIGKIPKINEGLPAEEIINNLVKVINNLCFM